MTTPSPSVETRDEVTSGRAANHHAAVARKLLTPQRLNDDPVGCATVHALLAIEARLDEITWSLGALQS